MTFWEQFKEYLLDSMFGAYQRQTWRDEKKRYEDCERHLQIHHEDSRRLMGLTQPDNSI